MQNKPESMAESPDEIMAHMRRLMAEAEALIAGPVTDHSGRRFQELRERFAALQERMGETYSQARRKVVAGARATDETIRSYPYASLAVALGVGVLVGAALSRGRE
ncbi:MAG TPA: hypothetical protein VNR00_10695 [Opitutus sp.]|nr:hypothetical protein [Opitutus sp.]